MLTLDRRRFLVGAMASAVPLPALAVEKRKVSLYQKVMYITPTQSIEVYPQASGGVALGSGIFTTPKLVTYNTYAGNGVYSLQDQGLIAFMANDPAPPWGTPYSDAGYRIVTKSDGTMDTLPLMEAMAALCSYGTFDEASSIADLTNIVKTRPVELRCGYVTPFVNSLATGVGIETRQMHLLNVTANNFFDDGHVLSEAKVGGVWKAFDVPNDIAWKDGSGNLLSLKEVIEAGAANCSFRRLAVTRVGRNSLPWVSVIEHQQFGTDIDLMEWCQRIYQVPGIAVGSGIVWGVPDALWSYKSQIEAYAPNWTTKTWSQWVADYY